MEQRTDAIWIALRHQPISVDDVFAFLQTPKAGGVNLFVGTTRQWTAGKETARLAYESYPPMALKEMARLADEAGARWPVCKVSLHHRLGEVPPTEASVIIGVATPHRADAFAACRFLIDALKSHVPIWKREVYADGSEEWVESAWPADGSEPP